MFISKSFVIVAACTFVNAYNILCLFPYPGKSHHMVFEPLLEELVDRGHDLTVVSFFPRSEPRAKRRDVSLRGLAELNVEVIDMKDVVPSHYMGRYFEDVPITTRLARSNLELCKTLLDSAIFDEFVNARGDYDLIITEHFNSDCMLGIIHNYGLPSVGLMSCALLPWSYSRIGTLDNPAYVPGMTLPFTDSMEFFERVENTFVLFFYILWFEVEIRWKEQRYLERKLNKKLPLLENVGKNASLVLVNTHHSWNGVRVLPASVVEVGGIHLHKRTIHKLPVDLENWVSSAKHGFVVFSFGTLIRSSSMTYEMTRAILNVLARIPQRVLWKREDDIDGLPDNVRVMRWLPQYEVLSHNNCVAFITHGGLLSLTETVSVGVPVLVVPLLGDQFGNAEHARVAGFARVLRLKDVNEENFAIALQDVLSPEIRFIAKQLRLMWQDRQHPPMDTAIYHIERTVRHNSLDFSTRARSLNRFQLALIDVLAFVLVLFITSAFIISEACTRIWRKIQWNVKNN